MGKGSECPALLRAWGRGFGLGATLRLLERGGGLSADAAAEISQALDLPAPAATPAPAAAAAVPAKKAAAVDPNVATVKEFAGAPDL